MRIGLQSFAEHALPIKFQADADLDVRIVAGMKRSAPEVDFRTANEASLRSLPDPEVLRICAESARMLVSCDRQTMPDHFFDFIAKSHSPGIVLARQDATFSSLISDLLLIWSVSTPEECANRITWIPF